MLELMLVGLEKSNDPFFPIHLVFLEFCIKDTIKLMAEAAELIVQQRERIEARDKFFSERSLVTDFAEFTQINGLCNFDLTV